MRFTKMLDLITNVLNKDADTQVDVCLTSQMANQIVSIHRLLRA